MPVRYGQTGPKTYAELLEERQSAEKLAQKYGYADQASQQTAAYDAYKTSLEEQSLPEPQQFGTQTGGLTTGEEEETPPTGYGTQTGALEAPEEDWANFEHHWDDIDYFSTEGERKLEKEQYMYWHQSPEGAELLKFLSDNNVPALGDFMYGHGEYMTTREAYAYFGIPYPGDEMATGVGEGQGAIVGEGGGFEDPDIVTMGESGFAPIDPRQMQSLAELQGQVDSSAYEEELRRLSQAKLMKGQELGQQIGETTQAMGSRGQGRVAQIARASELDLQAGYSEEIIKAKESADLASREASKMIDQIIKTGVDEYATMHGLSIDERNQHLNEANQFIGAMDILRADLITSGVLAHKVGGAGWEEWGKFYKQAYEEWMAAPDTATRAAIAVKYAAFTADDYNSSVEGATISAIESSGPAP